MECKPHGGDLALIRPHYYTVPVSCWRRPAVIRLAVLTDLHNNLYGSLIKSLEDFEGVCLSLMDGMFSGYDPMISVQCLDSVRLGDCLDFIK